MVQYAEYPSPLGLLLLESDGDALTGLWMNRKAPPGAVLADGDGIFSDVVAWLDAYFRGEPGQIDFPLKPAGTDFQKRVWQRLLEIPYGETVSYGTIAREIAGAMGKEKMSAQAVGQAVGRNPVAIIIPCHRVVGAGGKLTGYAYGIEKKQWLLSHEQEKIR